MCIIQLTYTHTHAQTNDVKLVRNEKYSISMESRKEGNNEWKKEKWNQICWTSNFQMAQVQKDREKERETKKKKDPQIQIK